MKCGPSKHGLRLVPSNSSPRSQLMQVDNVLPKIRLLRPCFVCMYLYIDTLTYISTLRCLLSSYNASPHISTYLVSQYMCVYSHIQIYIYIHTYYLFVYVFISILLHACTCCRNGLGKTIRSVAGKAITCCSWTCNSRETSRRQGHVNINYKRVVAPRPQPRSRPV